MFDGMDRPHELEDLRRSIAMLEPRTPALNREAAMALIEELQTSAEQLRRLRQDIHALLERGHPEGGRPGGR
jgi:transposase